jgi:hypothetical protein
MMDEQQMRQLLRASGSGLPTAAIQVDAIVSRSQRRTLQRRLVLVGAVATLTVGTLIAGRTVLDTTRDHVALEVKDPSTPEGAISDTELSKLGIDVTGATSDPVVSRQQALDIVTDGCCSNRPATAEDPYALLRQATTRHYRHNDLPVVDDRLVWLVVVPDMPVAVSGPPATSGTSSQPSPAPPPRYADLVVIVDALSGEELYAIQRSASD